MEIEEWRCTCQVLAQAVNNGGQRPAKRTAEQYVVTTWCRQSKS